MRQGLHEPLSPFLAIHYGRNIQEMSGLKQHTEGDRNKSVLLDRPQLLQWINGYLNVLVLVLYKTSNRLYQQRVLGKNQKTEGLNMLM